MKKYATLTLSGYAADFVNQAATILHVEPEVIVQRLIYATAARRSACQEAYPENAERAIIPEFMMSPDGKLFPETNEQLFVAIREYTRSQLEALKEGEKQLDAFKDEVLKAIEPQGNA